MISFLELYAIHSIDSLISVLTGGRLYYGWVLYLCTLDRVTDKMKYSHFIARTDDSKRHNWLIQVGQVLTIALLIFIPQLLSLHKWELTNLNYLVEKNRKLSWMLYK